ncbi:MAG: hypothetical protein PHQ25_08295 [Acidobacteriota bacterium]|nr:hypothetical protein [Acidobacteriota bacterium]MDW3229816.1 hypothetical protein [Acidobacteriota bacterium]
MKTRGLRSEKKRVRAFWLIAVLSCSVVFVFLLSELSQASAQIEKGSKSPVLSQMVLAGKVTGSQARTKDKNKQESPPSTDKLKGLPEETIKILKENKFLEEELKLAGKPAYYFVINLKEKKVDLKARGMVLKSWNFSDLRYSGKPVPLKVTSLTHKTALDPPERKIIQPDEEQDKDEKEMNEMKESQPEATGTFEVEALELADMPSSFDLNFDDGLKISIQSKSGLKETFHQTWENILWYTWYPIKHFIIRKSELKPRLVIYFENQREAQAIYWAFIDGIKGIIWFP